MYLLYVQLKNELIFISNIGLEQMIGDQQTIKELTSATRPVTQIIYDKLPPHIGLIDKLQRKLILRLVGEAAADLVHDPVHRPRHHLVLEPDLEELLVELDQVVVDEHARLQVSEEGVRERPVRADLVVLLRVFHQPRCGPPPRTAECACYDQLAARLLVAADVARVAHELAAQVLVLAGVPVICYIGYILK